MRQLNDAVVRRDSSRSERETFPAATPQNTHNAIRILDGLRPTSGNLAPSESWRRMLGGRKRYNHQRQQIARARRYAILIWLMQKRRYFYCAALGENIPVNRIILRHGDGAMLAGALGVGKATVCRDLSALQASHSVLFGSASCGIPYDEYMTFWRYAHRTGLGNEQPHQNLRYPNNQRGPAVRAMRVASRAIGKDVTDQRVMFRTQHNESTESAISEQDTDSATLADFLCLLRANCRDDEIPTMPMRRNENSHCNAIV